MRYFISWSKELFRKRSQIHGTLGLEKHTAIPDKISRRVGGLPLYKINKDVVNLFLDIEGLEKIELVLDSFRDQDL